MFLPVVTYRYSFVRRMAIMILRLRLRTLGIFSISLAKSWCAAVQTPGSCVSKIGSQCVGRKTGVVRLDGADVGDFRKFLCGVQVAWFLAASRWTSWF